MQQAIQQRLLRQLLQAQQVPRRCVQLQADAQGTVQEVAQKVACLGVACRLLVLLLVLLLLVLVLLLLLLGVHPVQHAGKA